MHFLFARKRYDDDVTLAHIHPPPPHKHTSHGIVIEGRERGGREGDAYTHKAYVRTHEMGTKIHSRTLRYTWRTEWSFSTRWFYLKLGHDKTGGKGFAGALISTVGLGF